MSNISTRLVKATEIDGCAATEDRDSQNEVLSLDGANIDQMTSKGVFNDNHGQGFANTLGKITYAKKIFKESDVEDDRQKKYWNKLGRPFLYVRGRLFDEGDHANAKAVAAIMKEFKKMGTSLSVQMSVEGKVVNRGDNGHLKESLIRNVALTLVPANSNTGAQVVSEELRRSVLAKCQEVGASIEYADNLMKSLSAGVAPIPSRGFIEVIDDSPYEKVYKNIEEISNRIKMYKALTVGYGGSGSPASRVGGSVLTGEKAAGQKLVSVAGPALKVKRRNVLKTLIRKTKTLNPGLSYEKVVEAVLKVFHNK